MPKATPFDTAEYLDNPEMIAAYLNEVFESDNHALIMKAIGAAARSQDLAMIAEKSGLSRENLNRVLYSDAKPEFGAIIKVLHALGIELVAQPHGPSKAA